MKSLRWNTCAHVSWEPHTLRLTYAKWEWRTAEHLFSRHQVIAPFNTQAALRSALDLGATPTVYFARHDPHPSLEQMPCLPFYIPSGKGTTFPPGVLVLYPGQILRLQGVRANPKTGIVNGAKVKLLHIEINPAERSVLVPGCPRELTSTPLFLKVRLLKPGQVRLQVPGLETDEFFDLSTKATLHVPPAWPHSKSVQTTNLDDTYPVSCHDGKRSHGVHRTRYCFTACHFNSHPLLFKGASFDYAVVDLRKPPTGLPFKNSGLANYVTRLLLSTVHTSSNRPKWS